MSARLALRPDLDRCRLEGRVLPALATFLMPSAFLPVNSSSNQFIVSGTSPSLTTAPTTSVSANFSLSSTPGPSFYLLRIGVSLSSGSGGVGSVAGSSLGGTVSLFGVGNTVPSLASLMGGGSGGLGSNGGGGSGGGGGGGGAA